MLVRRSGSDIEVSPSADTADFIEQPNAHPIGGLDPKTIGVTDDGPIIGDSARRNSAQFFDSAGQKSAVCQRYEYNSSCPNLRGSRLQQARMAEETTRLTIDIPGTNQPPSGTTGKATLNDAPV